MRALCMHVCVITLNAKLADTCIPVYILFLNNAKLWLPDSAFENLK